MVYIGPGSEELEVMAPFFNCGMPYKLTVTDVGILKDIRTTCRVLRLAKFSNSRDIFSVAVLTVLNRFSSLIFLKVCKIKLSQEDMLRLYF